MQYYLQTSKRIEAKSEINNQKSIIRNQKSAMVDIFLKITKTLLKKVKHKQATLSPLV